MLNFSVDINPKVLAWAQTESKYKDSEVAEELGVDATVYGTWLSHGKAIRYTDVKRLAKLFKRQVSVLLMEDVPPSPKKPKYRNLSSRHEDIGKDAALFIRRTSYYLDIYRDVQSPKLLAQNYEWHKKIQPSLKDSWNTLLRGFLKSTVQDQRENSSNAFKYWREKFENELNVFVFQFPLKSKEYDGFSYTGDGIPYAITLNSEISDTRKVFTLFHELGHILEGESGVCLVKPSTNNAEARCNMFAADFLMPESEIIPVVSYRELCDNASSLGVSPEAYLIRLDTLGLIDTQQYADIKKAIKDKEKSYVPAAKSKGGPSRLVTVKSQRGNKFFEFVLTGFDAGTISPSQVRDVLGMRVVGLRRRDA